MTVQELYEFAEKFVKVGKGSGTVSADINIHTEQNGLTQTEQEVQE